MKKVEESIVIDRSADEVFAFFDDRSNDGRWMVSVHESEWLDPDAATGIGRRGRMVMDAMGRREFEDEVTEYEHGRKVGHRSVSGSLVIHTACMAEPTGDGRYRVTVSYEPERLPGGPFGKLLAPISMRVVRKNYRADLARLKEVLEAERPPER